MLVLSLRKSPGVCAVRGTRIMGTRYRPKSHSSIACTTKSCTPLYFRTPTFHSSKPVSPYRTHHLQPCQHHQFTSCQPPYDNSPPSPSPGPATTSAPSAGAPTTRTTTPPTPPRSPVMRSNSSRAATSSATNVSSRWKSKDCLHAQRAVLRSPSHQIKIWTS